MIKYIAAAALGLLAIAGVVFDVVPESASWALMILGFAAVGTMIRRHDEDGPRVRFP